MEHETTLVEVALDSSSGQILKVTPVVCNGWLYGSAENMKGFYSYWKHDHTFFPCESPERIELFLKRALPLERNAYYVLKVDASGTIDWLLELSGLTKVPFASIVPAKGGFTWLVGTYEGVLNVQEKELVSSVNDGMRESFVLRVSPKGEVVYAATFPQFPKKGSFGFQGTFGLSDGGLLLIDEFAGAATLEGCGDAAFELQSSPLETGVSAMAFRDTGCIVWAKELILGRPLLVNLHTAPGGALILTGKKGRRYSEDFKVLFQGPSTAE